MEKYFSDKDYRMLYYDSFLKHLQIAYMQYLHQLFYIKQV